MSSVEMIPVVLVGILAVMYTVWFTHEAAASQVTEVRHEQKYEYTVIVVMLGQHVDEFVLYSNKLYVNIRDLLYKANVQLQKELIRFSYHGRKIILNRSNIVRVELTVEAIEKDE